MSRIPEASSTGTTWRQPEAPRPSRNTSRGTAALLRASLSLLPDVTVVVPDGYALRTRSGRADIDADGADLALRAARFGDSIGSAGGVAPAR